MIYIKQLKSLKSQAVLQPHLMGTNTRHSADFEIDRSCDPYGTNLILIFRSPAIILTAGGMETAQIGDCIVHSVDFKQYHRGIAGAAEGYRNDWLHVRPEILAPIMTYLVLPFNQLIATGQPEILTPFIRQMQDELLMADEFSEAVLTTLLEGMCLAVARGRMTMMRQQDRMTNIERRYFQQFQELRKQMLSDCDHGVAIKELAARVNLSPERFAALYRKFFNVTPYAEMIDVRIIKAKQLLLSTSMEIKEIAVVCGWDNIHYFSRLFKIKTGISPSQYRHYVSTGLSDICR